ncbi:hypothetical protein ACVIHC_002505 [Bradyrhizobium diazoefficiens]
MRLAPASLLFSTSLFGFFLLCDSSGAGEPNLRLSHGIRRA